MCVARPAVANIGRTRKTKKKVVAGGFGTNLATSLLSATALPVIGQSNRSTVAQSEISCRTAEYRYFDETSRFARLTGGIREPVVLISPNLEEA
jgi:hypothetical protein